MTRANCGGEPLENFFEAYIKDKDIYEQTNFLCQTCKVRKICLNYGRVTKAYGVWGGKLLQNGSIVEILVLEEDDG